MSYTRFLEINAVAKTANINVKNSSVSTKVKDDCRMTFKNSKYQLVLGIPYVGHIIALSNEYLSLT